MFTQTSRCIHMLRTCNSWLTALTKSRYVHTDIKVCSHDIVCCVVVSVAKSDVTRVHWQEVTVRGCRLPRLLRLKTHWKLAGTHALWRSSSSSSSTTCFMNNHLLDFLLYLFQVVDSFSTGFPRLLENPWFIFQKISRSWEELENEICPGKSWKLKCRVLELICGSN